MLNGDAFVQAFGDAPPVYRCVALVINAVCPSVTGMKPQVEFVSALANHQPSVNSGMLHSSCSAFSFVMVFQNRRLGIHQFLYLLILLDGYDRLVCALNLNILQITVILDFLLLQEIRRIFLVVGYDAAVKELRSIFEMYDANHCSFPSAVSRPAFSSSYWMVVTPIPLRYIS